MLRSTLSVFYQQFVSVILYSSAEFPEYFWNKITKHFVIFIKYVKFYLVKKHVLKANSDL